MGIDAEMMIGTKERLDERALLRLSYETGCAFQGRGLWIRRDNKFGGPRHALSFVESTDWQSINEIPGAETRFKVNLAGRYYGIGYERGSLTFYLDLARWFRSKLPGCTVLYGGDQESWLQELTPEYETELWNHFVANQHRPYIEHHHRDGDGLDDRFCHFCQEPMIRYGSGGNFAAFRCPGCGLYESTHNHGKTWQQEDKS